VCSIPSSLNFQYSLASLRSSSSSLRVLPHFPGTSILLSVFPSITCFIRRVLCWIWPIQLACPLFIVCLHDPFYTSSFLTQSVQLIVSILLSAPNFKTSQVSLVYFLKFQHLTQPSSKCSSLLVSSLNLSPVCWWRKSSFCWMLLLPRQSWI
jgi:hypothetical protein